MKNCEILHLVLHLFFILFFKMFINFGREEQCMTSINMCIYCFMMFCENLSLCSRNIWKYELIYSIKSIMKPRL